MDDDIRCNQNSMGIIATDRKDKNYGEMIEDAYWYSVIFLRLTRGS